MKPSNQLTDKHQIDQLIECSLATVYHFTHTESITIHLCPAKSMVETPSPETPTMAAPWAHAEPLQSYPVIREASRRIDTAPFANVNQPC